MVKTLHLPGTVTEGVCILDVKSPSPGADAGLREHDVIVAVDGKPIRDIIDSVRPYMIRKLMIK